MQAYIIRRVVLLFPTLIGLTFIVFISVRFIPGDIVDQLLVEAESTPELRAQLEEEYNLNGNIPVSYVQWLGDVLRGDLGESALSKRPITDSLKERMPASIELGILALLVSQVLALPIGILSAIRQDSFVDFLGRSFAILLLAVPSFWLALLAITYGFIWFNWTPPLQYVDVWEDPIANLKLLWIPAIILGAQLSGSVMRLTRSTMLEVLRQDYVRTAYSKGLRERSVIVRHALRNAIIPVVTVIGLQIPLLVGGTVIIESVFSIPGMGSFLLASVNSRDYPAIQAVVLITATAVVLSNLVVDLVYPLIDPRIRYS